jgi:anaerobic selenocysteine-containing dehydrogenase
VPRLKKIFSRQTLEISEVDAKKRKIINGDICRVFNGLGETFAYALIVKGLLPGTINVPKQIRASQLIDDSNINSLVPEEVADFGKGPIYYSTFAEVEKHL